MDTVCLKSLLNFEEKPDYISIESETVSFDALKEEFELFKKIGYSSFKAVNQLDITKQKEPENSEEGKFCNYSFLDGATGLFGKDLPNKWKNEKQMLREYKLIFIKYKLLGNYGILKRNKIGLFVYKVIRKLFPRLVRSWYDTHARHNSVN